MPSSEVFTAKVFQLVDDDNKVRAKLHLWDGKQPTLTFYDSGGGIRLSIGLSNKESPNINLSDKEEPRISLIANETMTGLILSGKDGQNNLELIVQVDGSPSVTLRKDDGTIIWDSRQTK